MPEEEEPAKQEPKRGQRNTERTEEHREEATWRRRVGPKSFLSDLDTRGSLITLINAASGSSGLSLCMSLMWDLLTEKHIRKSSSSLRFEVQFTGGITLTLADTSNYFLKEPLVNVWSYLQAWLNPLTIFYYTLKYNVKKKKSNVL